jgi:hypothetical protein
MFFEKTGNNMDHILCFSPKIFSSRIVLSNELSCGPNEDRMPKLRPWEFDVSITSIGARKPFGFSSSRVRVLDFNYVKKALRASL